MEPSVGNEAKPVSFLHILWGIRLPSGKTVKSPSIPSWINRQQIEARGYSQKMRGKVLPLPERH